jgi:hypothetical protein
MRLGLLGLGRIGAFHAETLPALPGNACVAGRGGRRSATSAAS